MPVEHLLFAMPASLYSAKARAYLRTHRIPHREVPPGDPRYVNEVVPAIGRWIIPVLKTPDGTLIQDTVDVIDRLDRDLSPELSAYPATPVHRVIAHLLDLFGGEGLLRPAMHYRWNFDEANLDFLANDFSAALVLDPDPEAKRAAFDFASSRMRRVTTRFGVTPETIPDVERSFLRFLDLFDAHLADAPYLLGGRPTIADFAFAGPLYAHLSRDPYPSMLMKRHARRVYRWTERMNAPGLDSGEYGDRGPELFPDDAVPATLCDLLAYIGEEFTADILAQVAGADAWLAANPQAAEGDLIGGRPDRRAIGTTMLRWRGHAVEVGVLPYRVHMLQRLQRAFADTAPATQNTLTALFAKSGLEPLLGARPRRRVERRENVEVWGRAQEPNLPATHASHADSSPSASGTT
jgi:glutathione S-transferase